MSNQSILAQAQLLTDEEQYEKAYELLAKSYEEMKSDAEYLEKIALLAKMLEKREDAAKYWEELVSINPNSVLGYSELLDIYVNTNKYKYYLTRAKYKILNQQVSQSVDDYKKAIGSTTEESELINARFLLAKSYEYLGKTQNAIDEYYNIIEHKDDMAVYYKLADLYIELNDRFSAINILERGVKAFPNVVELKEYLAGLYMREGEYDKAIEHAVNDFTKIKAYLMKGENEIAFSMLEKVEERTNANYPALMAEYYFNKKNWEKCLEYVEKFNELSPQNPLVYQMKALVCEENGDSAGYHFNMGRCYSYKQDYELAQSEYLAAHRYDPNNGETVKEIIKVNETLGDKTGIMEFYEKLARIEPDNTFALKGLGDVYKDMYEFKDAAEYYEKALKAGTSDYEIYNRLGFCYEKMRDIASAKNAYEKYLEKAPLSPDTEKLKEKLAKMDTSASVSQAGSEEGIIDKIMKLFGK